MQQEGPRLRFGLGAWSNKHFDHSLYPIRTLHAEYLPRYATVFGAAEADRLYHYPAATEPLAEWAASVPDGFRFLPKLHKSVCAGEHGLDDAALAIAKQEIEAYRDLGERRGPALAQFPPSFHFSETGLDALARLLRLAPAGGTSVELRHPSWWRDEVRSVLEQRKAPLVWTTHPKARCPHWVTGDWGHIRFVGRHFNTRGRHPTVDDRLDAILDLRAAVAEVASDGAWSQCFVIITNTFEGNAVDSLPRIAAALGETDLARRCTRKPGEPLFPGPPPSL